jgi:23S rRNA pseudouridine2605 synthase
LIVDGAVTVNGSPAVPGQDVNPGVDVVRVKGLPVKAAAQQTYLMLNKPIGVLSSAGDDRGRKSVTDELPPGGPRVYPVGRLDLQSRGLILLTDDGELAVRLMHPRYHVEKEYRVLVSGQPEDDDLRRVSEGMVVNGARFLPAEVRIIEKSARESRLSMILREGRKREIRRLWQALGHRVIDLQRIRIDGIHLGDLEEGAIRALRTEEIARLRAAAGL